MKTIIIGGDFGSTPKESSIIKKLSNILYCDCINGGTIEDIKNIDLSGYKLIIWAANIDNSIEKIYPKKDVGSILIVTKVLREDRTEVDAITRIFTMHANAVIAIKSNQHPFIFKLMDALGNVWCDTTDMSILADSITNIYKWTNSSIRKRCVNVGDGDFDFSEYQEFIDINKKVADIFEENKGRYFGNTSTRCMKMFPTNRVDSTHMIVSRRDVSKKRLTTEDLVMTTSGRINSNPYELKIEYYGKNKPSVDTPIQLALYEKFPNINYMIHGHSYIKKALYTDKYYPCGDMREVDSVSKYMIFTYGVVNLRNHGFLIYADTIDNLKNIVNKISFVERKVGFEKVYKKLI